MDVSFNLDNGVKTAMLVNKMIKADGSSSALKPLIIILKTFLIQRGLNEVFTGGLGSYALFVLVSSFLKVLMLA